MVGVTVHGDSAVISIPEAYANIPKELIDRGLTHDQAVVFLQDRITRRAPRVRSFRVCGVKLRDLFPDELADGGPAAGTGGKDPDVVIGGPA